VLFVSFAFKLIVFPFPESQYIIIYIKGLSDYWSATLGRHSNTLQKYIYFLKKPCFIGKNDGKSTFFMQKLKIIGIF